MNDIELLIDNLIATVTLAYDKCNRAELDDITTARAALLAAYPRWISVGERLPEVGGKYLATSGHVVEMTHYTPGYGLPGYTHWMPLPAPPEVEG